MDVCKDLCLFLIGTVLSIAIAACGSSSATKSDVKLRLVSFSVTKAAHGQGDVLINYENEVILAEINRPKLPYVVPQVNISIDNPVAVVDKNVDKHGTREVAEAFVDFLYSAEAQREFAKLGYRPVNPNITQDVAFQYPKVETLFTSQDLGGWDNIQKKFFVDGAIFDKVQDSNKP